MGPEEGVSSLKEGAQGPWGSRQGARAAAERGGWPSGRVGPWFLAGMVISLR